MGRKPSSKNKENENSQFMKDLRRLGVENSIIGNIMEIHKNNPNLVPYECKRLYNIQRNQEKLDQLNITEIKSVINLPKLKLKPQKRILKEEESQASFQPWFRKLCGEG